jgi:hypothetical protein
MRWTTWSTNRRIWTAIAVIVPAAALALNMAFELPPIWVSRGSADATYEAVAASITSVVGSPATSSTDGWEPSACSGWGATKYRKVRSSAWELSSEVGLPSVFAAAESAATSSGFRTYMEPEMLGRRVMKGSAGLLHVDYSLWMSTLPSGEDSGLHPVIEQPALLLTMYENSGCRG